MYYIILYSLITDQLYWLYTLNVFNMLFLLLPLGRSLCELILYFTFSDPLRILTTSTFDTYTINNHFPWTQTPVNSITFIKDDQYTENHWLCGVVQGSGQACIWSA